MKDPKPAKVLFAITKSNWGGAQRYVFDLATHLRGRGFDVAVALGGTGAPGAPGGTLERRLEEAGVRTLFLKSFTRDVGLLREIAAFGDLYRTIRRERPDILHLNSSKAGGLGALVGRLCGIRHIVFTSHGLAYDEDRPFVTRFFIGLATWLTILLSHTTIVISEDTHLRAQRLPFCRSKIRLVSNGITAQPLLDRAAARSRLLPHAESNHLWIGTISELTRNKGLSYLVDAAALLKKEGLSFTLCIIGEGELRASLEEQIEKHDLHSSVHLLGFVPSAATLLSAFDIFTLTSVKEGLPYVLLEAGQAKCAVVASRIPGVTDVVARDGILVEPKEPRAIAHALNELMSNESKRFALATALYERVSHTFSMEHMLDQIVEIYGT